MGSSSQVQIEVQRGVRPRPKDFDGWSPGCPSKGSERSLLEAEDPRKTIPEMAAMGSRVGSPGFRSWRGTNH
ncbi:hypothetical protein GUJ93_ZPchr0011g28419 [Zizania palustris]|uniref:Uncharacterized protein n=1 Tax=Zizania palustris TaxID=103762 RepID=A0A8J5WGL4_ZIZPA|nr:hypothetical protein GUJ93_ZPchr0011g28419 [Zizania palustris]